MYVSNLFLCNISYTNEHKIDIYPSISVSILLEIGLVSVTVFLGWT